MDAKKRSAVEESREDLRKMEVGVGVGVGVGRQVWMYVCIEGEKVE